ncbi:MAG: site-2 protease family protein, partial [candidate division KSB1 bacterium]|nr:site-2 protease family protein [candidate division KSB1 bacterium]
GLDFSWYLTKEITLALKRIFIGELPVKDALAGPVGIVKMAGESARRGFDVLLYFTGMLSLNLGLLNVLPIPVLDGGHLVYLFIEAIIRRPIPVKAKMIVQQIGMALLLALIVFIIINDIRRFW